MEPRPLHLQPPPPSPASPSQRREQLTNRPLLASWRLQPPNRGRGSMPSPLGLRMGDDVIRIAAGLCLGRPHGRHHQCSSCQKFITKGYRGRYSIFGRWRLPVVQMLTCEAIMASTAAISKAATPDRLLLTTSSKDH